MKTTIKQATLREMEFAKNISDRIPSFEAVNKETKAFSRLLYSALENAQQMWQELLDSQKDKQKATKMINRWYEAPTIRYFLQQYLHAEDIETQLWDDDGDTEKPSWEPPQVLANNGLAGEFNGFPYRIVKGKDGVLPPPGRSSIKKAYFRQDRLMSYQSSLIANESEAEYKPIKPNIVFLWEFDPKGIPRIYLSVPRWGDEFRAYDYYTKLIPHPVTTITKLASQIIEDTAYKISDNAVDNVDQSRTDKS